MKKFLVLMTTGLMVCSLAACGSAKPASATSDSTETTTSAEVSAEGETSAEAQAVEAPFFTKNVYVNYAAEAENPTKDYFYVFYDEGAGYTEDGSAGIGVPFSCVQEGDTVTFSFGGADEESKQVFKVSSVEGNLVKGKFEETEMEMIFERLDDADPDNFDSKAYLAAAGDSSAAPADDTAKASADETVYNDPNGWSLKYDASKFDVNNADNVVTFVYKGESAGTNMITATYEASKDAKTYVDEITKSWDADKTTTVEGVFPGTEDVKAYFASLTPAEGGSGAYSTLIARDYMEGTLAFEVTGHVSGNEEADMEVSDYLSAVIDSVTFS